MSRLTAVISVRVRDEVRRLLERGGVNVGEEVRRFLEELAWRIKVREYVERWDGLLRGVEPSARGFSARSVREDREGH